MENVLTCLGLRLGIDRRPSVRRDKNESSPFANSRVCLPVVLNRLARPWLGRYRGCSHRADRISREFSVEKMVAVQRSRIKMYEEPMIEQAI
jgi:hypothetical protein